MDTPVIFRDPDVMSGTPVFAGTRVPVQTLLDYLEGGETIADFPTGFPSVSRRQVIAFLESPKQDCDSSATHCSRKFYCDALLCTRESEVAASTSSVRSCVLSLPLPVRQHRVQLPCAPASEGERFRSSAAALQVQTSAAKLSRSEPE